MIRVKAGANKDSAVEILPNNQDTPLKISSKQFSGYIVLRLDSKHPFTVIIQGTFSTNVKVGELFYKFEFEKPINVPSYAQKLFSLLAPHSTCDFKSDKPFIKSYCMLASSHVQIYPNKLDAFCKEVNKRVNLGQRRFINI